MAKRTSPGLAPDPTLCGSIGVADGLARSSLDLATPSSAVIDRSLAPPGAPFAVVMPRCAASTCKARQPAAVSETDPPDVFTDLIDPACWLALTDEDRARLRVQPMPTARFAIDRVVEGMARSVQPSFEDVARVASPDDRAYVLLALGWLAATCGCLQALLNSVPDDTPPGIYVRAGAVPPTSQQRDDDERAERRRRERSAAWSAHLKAMAEARRRPPVGNLFGPLDAGTSSAT